MSDRDEFIKVQTQLENLQLPKHERKALLKREGELLAKNRDAWVDEDMKLARSAQPEKWSRSIPGFNRELLTFSKGVLDIVTASDADMRSINSLSTESEKYKTAEQMYKNIERLRTNPSLVELKILMRMGLAEEKELMNKVINTTLFGSGEIRMQKLQLLIDQMEDINAITHRPRMSYQGAPEHGTLLHHIDWASPWNSTPTDIETARLVVRNGADLDTRYDKGDPSTSVRISLAKRDKGDKMRAAVLEEEALYRENLPMTEKVPEKGSGFSKKRH